MRYIARQATHIKEDLKRGWSSWNFGQDGFYGTRNDLNEYLATSTDNNPVTVSGFEIYPMDIDSFNFGELYDGYWVAIDNSRGGGLSAIELQADNENDAILEAINRKDYFGEGITFNPNDFDLIYSAGDIHIFKEKE